MEKRSLIIGLIVLIVIVILAFVFLQTQPTGQATFTPGANYGPVEPNFNVFANCKYLGSDDGWDVTVKTEVEYLDRTTGRTGTYADACSGGGVTELHCEDGYRKARTVNCPSGTSCKDGACVAN